MGYKTTLVAIAIFLSAGASALAQTNLKLEHQLSYAMQGDEVRLLQKLLASDPEIYPQSIMSGYFGNLTETAVMKFQKKACLRVTGYIDQKTLNTINGILTVHAGAAGNIPPGLLKKLGAQNKLCGSQTVVVPPVAAGINIPNAPKARISDSGIPDLDAWLAANPNVAASIKWQIGTYGSGNNVVAPRAEDKIAWQRWTQSQKDDLRKTYAAAYKWLKAGATPVPVEYNGLTDRPENLQKNLIAVQPEVSAAYMWKLYTDNIGFSLALEISKQVPWTITSYSDEALRYLFDSSTMGWKNSNGNFSMGSHVASKLRADNLPQTSFAPAMWTYGFMKSGNLIGANKLDTIGAVIDWMRHNMQHFFGRMDLDTFDAVWQYRGYPPVSRIVSGTIDRNHSSRGIVHYTAGCHGSVGFMNEVLRVVNIPVQPVWTCSHELPYFLTEKKYLTHGDDPYGANLRESPIKGSDFLIDEATYRGWFTANLSVNIGGVTSSCPNIGRRPRELSGK